MRKTIIHKRTVNLGLLALALCCSFNISSEEVNTEAVAVTESNEAEVVSQASAEEKNSNNIVTVADANSGQEPEAIAASKELDTNNESTDEAELVEAVEALNIDDLEVGKADAGDQNSEAAEVNIDNVSSETETITETAEASERVQLDSDANAKAEAVDSGDKTFSEKFKNIFSFFNSSKKSDESEEDTSKWTLTDIPHPVEDLAYGEALFSYYTDNDFDALVRLRVAQEKNQLSNNKKHSDLLLTQLYISQGLPKHAANILSKLDDETISDETKTLAIHQLARINKYQGDLAEARRLLEADQGKAGDDLASGRDILLSQIYVEQQDKAATESILEKIDPATIRNFYSKYNLAMSGLFVENDELALSLLAELSTISHSDLETRSLRDKVFLTLGQYYLESEDTEKAKEFFAQVGYAGPHSSAALYYLAWIDLNDNRFSDSFSLWVNLSKRNPMDRYVGRSFLIRPYALEKLKSDDLALDGYFYAADLYEKLLSDLEETIELVKSGNWVNKLKPANLSSISMYETIGPQPEWIKAKQLESNFLLSLYASDRFAITHQNFWEVEQLITNNENNIRKVTAFEEEYKSYSENFLKLRPEALDSLESNRNTQMMERIENVHKVLLKIENQGGFIAAPSINQLNNLDRVAYLHDQIDKENQEDTVIQRRYLEKLQSILAWDMSQNASDRQWKVKQQYQQVLKLLGETKQYYRHISSGLLNDKYTGMDTKLPQYSALLELKQLELELLSLKNQKLLQEIALEVLDERKDEYKKLKVKAKLAAARLQDKIVTGGL